MKVIKRNGTEVDFDKNKIVVAITKAADDTPLSAIEDFEINEIADYIEFKCAKMGRAFEIEEIQDMVENELMSKGHYDIARNYVKYRYQRSLTRNFNTTYDRILSLVSNKNEDIIQENSNKNPFLLSTQRDYIAGEISKDITFHKLMNKDVYEAHKKGIIHQHDTDYYIQKSLNCSLVALDDMLQNGTVISGVMIEKPKSLRTAATIMTQIMAQVASVQYGGQSMNIAHIAPFVDVSRKKIKASVIKEMEGIDISEDKINEITEGRLKTEIKDAVQTIQYQILTLNSSNGQSPFVSLYMNINDGKTDREKHDIAMLIEEILNQRIAGIKNDAGVPITIQFPKLLYVLDENNVDKDSEYYWLTELAAKCTAKRMVPDYISAKKCREYKEGNVISCMGCVDGSEVIRYKINNKEFTETFEQAWNRVYNARNTISHYSAHSVYMETLELSIYDTYSDGFVKVKKFIRNDDMGRWYRVWFGEHESIVLTEDHPLPTNRGRVSVKDLEIGDIIPKSNIVKQGATTYSITKIEYLGFRDRYEYDVETVSDHFDVSGINSHNCRSFLAPWKDEDGNYKFWGRSNLGVVTINLPYIALLSKRNEKEFWCCLDYYLEICYDAHMTRFERLKEVTSDYAPIMWQHGGLTRLKPGESVLKYLMNGYCSISLGYAGLYECVKYMTGESHISSEVGKDLGMRIMKYLNKKCDEWKNRTEYHLGWSVYGTPIESTTYKFAKALQRDFGKIKDVSDHNYITNSFHCNVREEIDAFTKLSVEGEYQKYSLGGSISYIECPNMTDNIEAVLSVMKFIYDNTLYAELNIKSDYCKECGWDKEIPIVDIDGKLVFQCPNCGNIDRRKMNIARRVCGYISTNDFNQGRTQEIKERVLHL